MISRAKKMIWELREHLLLQVWTDPLTGDLKHILQTFQSTMSIKKTESMIQMRLKVHTLITTRTYLIFTLQILPVTVLSFLQKQQMTPEMNL